MYKTLFCLSAVACLVSAGAFAEDADKDTNKAIEQSLAGCSCGKRDRTKDTKETKEGDKGNKDMAQCAVEDETVDGKVIAPEITLSCGDCGGRGK